MNSLPLSTLHVWDNRRPPAPMNRGGGHVTWLVRLSDVTVAVTFSGQRSTSTVRAAQQTHQHSRIFIYWPLVNMMMIMIARNSPVDEIGERYRLNHAIVVQAACQALVCRTMIRSACKPLANRTRLRLIYLLGVGSTDIACLWTKKFVNHSRSFNISHSKLHRWAGRV